MLRPAIHYREELESEWLKLIDEPWAMYYFSGPRWMPSPNLDSPSDNSGYYNRFLVSVHNGKVIGFISYVYDYDTGSADNWGIISFTPGGSIHFAEDLLYAIDDVFFKYNLQWIRFYCWEDNPAIDAYRRAMNKLGGREIGYMSQSGRLLDGKLHNSVMFELSRINYARSSAKFRHKMPER